MGEKAHKIGVERSPDHAIGVNSNPLCIGVDLLPLLPGAENGGAKLLAIELVKQLSRLASSWEFVLLTSDNNHDELALLDSQNVRRTCVLRRENPSGSRSSWMTRFENSVRDRLRRLLPPSARMKLDHAYRRAVRVLSRGNLLENMGADMLFCPFTAPFFSSPTIPVVSVIYDLQYRYYPQFFSVEERFCREKHFNEACRVAERLVCISNYVRKTVLENTNLEPEKVVSIPIRMHNRLKKPSIESILPVLQRLGLKKNEFLLYPANFWPHKNHQMLFTAFAMYRARHRESNLRLVCTGELNQQGDLLQNAICQMGQQERITLPGFLSDENFAALLAASLALVFPSLYEGFGMPVLEAMAFGKPVICSNVTSLPEVAGNAAYYIDPGKPLEIVQAIEQITTNERLVNELVELGHQRLALFGGPEKMACEYLDVFLEVFQKAGSTSRNLP